MKNFTFYFKQAVCFIYRNLVVGIVVPLLTLILSPGCSETRYAIDARLSNQLQSVLDEQRHVHGIPGISAALITSKSQKWIGVSGYSSEGDSIKPEMVFGIGSVTKTYIAVLALELAKEGKLSLDDPIKRWLSPIRFVDSTITIRQLLNHTSGLYKFQGTPEWFKEVTTNVDKIWTPKEIIDRFVKEPECKPGTCWGESATDYILLGMIIENVTGQKAVDVLRDRIIVPLKLKHTSIYPDETQLSKQLAHFWWDVDRSGKLVDVFPKGSKVPLAALFSSAWTTGAILSSAEDLAIFTKALFENRVLSEASLKQMITPIQLGQSLKYGFSVIIDTTLDGKTLYWHTGGIGYSSVFYYLPEDKLTAVVLCNAMVDPRPIVVALYNVYKKFGD